MIYNLANKVEAKAAYDRLRYLTKKGKRAEVTQIRENRTLSQNAFFHLLLTYFGSQVGYFPEEAKIHVKRHMKDIFAYEKNGETFLRSSADLSVDEMRQVLDRFYLLAGEQGVSLPLVDNEETRSMMLNEIEKSKF